MNADGFGVGWYAAGDPVPARYQRDIPIWNDPSLPDIARVTRSGAVLAAVRSATPGTAQGAAAAAPFGAGRWLFSHNGVLRNWREFESRISVTALLARGDDPFGVDPRCFPGDTSGPPESPADLRSLDVLTDSALLWALVLRLLRAGAGPGVALAAVIAEVEGAGGSGRFNFLLTDGRSVAATAAGDTLCYRRAGGGLTVASEPCDDEPGWTDVPGRHLLTGGPDGVTVTPLAAVLSQAVSPDAPTSPASPDEGAVVQ